MTRLTQTFEKVRTLAKERGGECLSQHFHSGQQKLKFRCGANHTWETTAYSVLGGTWCPECSYEYRHKSKRDKMLERAKNVAKHRGGECLSESYDFSGQKFRFRCSCGNEWEARPVDIVKSNGSWCNLCFDTSPKSMSVKDRHDLAMAVRRSNTVKKMHDIAKERGGECLTTEHVHHKAKFRFRCSEGHEWDALAGNIASGQWCRQCSNRESRGEKQSRLILEAMFNKPFPSQRPKWLRAKNGILLELDCYNEELGLAFEYQGHQHYGHQSLFHKGKSKTFERQAQRDAEKRQLVADSGRNIRLIEIPYFKDNITTAEAVDHITSLLKQNRIEIDCTKKISINARALYNRDLKDKILEIITGRGGRLLSKGVLGSTIKVRVACDKGHVWEVTPSKLMNGRWCRECANIEKNKAKMTPISVYQAVAAERGGQCLSTESMGVHVPHEWKCEKHGPFWATPREVMSKRNGGTWCPTCGKEKSNRTKMDKTFARIKAYAIERGGVCISESYDTARQKLNFRCSCGNEWPAESTSMLLQRSWCPTCGAKRGGFAAKKYIRKLAGVVREQLSLF